MSSLAASPWANALINSTDPGTDTTLREYEHTLLVL